jgi:glycosyltransferase involved in cell wall biosynthesis
LSRYADIRVLAPHASGAAPAEVLEGVNVRRFRYFLSRWQAVAYEGGIVARLREAPWRAVQMPFFLATLWWATIREIQRWQPDIIHAHWIIPQGLIACLAARRRVPILCTSHGGDLHGLRGPLFRWLKAWTLRRCQRVTVVSQSMVDHVRLLVPGIPIDVVPMGAELSSLFIPPEDPAVRRDNEIVFIGRLVEKKGLWVLLQAYEMLQQDRLDMQLTIAGDGPLREEIKRRVSGMRHRERITLLGSVPHGDLPAILQRATIAVFPFIVGKDGDQEGFGLVVIEAIGCGCPVIASDLPAIRQSIDDGITGILTPSGDPSALTEAMRVCLADASMRSRMATAALESARRQFDWPAIAAQYWRTVESGLYSRP